SGGFFSWRRNGTTGWVFRLADGTPTRREGAYGAQLDIADPASHATASRLADPQAEAGRYEGCGRAATDRPADDERPTWCERARRLRFSLRPDWRNNADHSRTPQSGGPAFNAWRLGPDSPRSSFRRAPCRLPAGAALPPARSGRRRAAPGSG